MKNYSRIEYKAIKSVDSHHIDEYRERFCSHGLRDDLFNPLTQQL